MRTEQVKYFLETVTAGSFTKAAENLHIQQPSLREAIINLENELGEQLFYRSKKGVTLTEYGRYCLPHFQLISASYEKIKEKDSVLYPPEILQIDMQSNYDVFAPAFYSNLRPQLREYEVRINTNNDLDTIASRLIQNRTNVAFICVLTDEENHSLYQAIQEQHLESSELRSFETVVLMRKGHPLASKKVLSYKDMKDYIFISNSNSSPAINIIQQKANIPSKNIIKIGAWKMVEHYLRSTDAITLSAKGTAYSEDLEVRSLKSAPIMIMQALYKKGCMDESILRAINVMKLTISNYL